MKKTKVIKFIFLGRRKAQPGEYYSYDNGFARWFGKYGSSETLNVYHKVETEEEVPRWRAKVGEMYYYVTMYYDININKECRSILDGMLYDANNYFQTQEQVQEYIDHCNKFFDSN
jgi:hypothetical protein